MVLSKYMVEVVVVFNKVGFMGKVFVEVSTYKASLPVLRTVITMFQCFVKLVTIKGVLMSGKCQSSLKVIMSPVTERVPLRTLEGRTSTAVPTLPILEWLTSPLRSPLSKREPEIVPGQCSPERQPLFRIKTTVSVPLTRLPSSVRWCRRQ